jgi:DNA-binding NarL/FixJ family response regulator
VQHALACVLAGQFVSPPRLVQSMFARLAGESVAPTSTWRTRAESADLTEREFEIVNLIADGLSNKQIARRLSVSLYTVKNHVHNLLQKLQASDRMAAVSHLRARGWLAKAV